jgi:hypothetical protein
MSYDDARSGEGGIAVTDEGVCTDVDDAAGFESEPSVDRASWSDGHMSLRRHREATPADVTVQSEASATAPRTDHW